MTSVKVFGAGSIGNHLAHACRSKDWDVTIADIDEASLSRAREEIYPSRYGQWDEAIRLVNAAKADTNHYDIVIVGTPPDTHAAVGLKALNEARPRIMLIEKPLSGPDLKGLSDLQQLATKTGTTLTVGYNHTLTRHTVRFGELLRSGTIGTPITLSTRTRENWQGIFAAHPWLNGPHDTYLGFSQRGGGACCEHSHAISMWLHIASVAGFGKVTHVKAEFDFVEKGGAAYDQTCFILLRTDQGATGDVIQDVVTIPTEKSARLQGDKGALEWVVNAEPGADAVRIYDMKEAVKEELFPKTRPDDFRGEIDHLDEMLQGGVKESPISFQHGVETMQIVAAAFRSQETGRTIGIDNDRGFGLEALY